MPASRDTKAIERGKGIAMWWVAIFLVFLYSILGVLSRVARSFDFRIDIQAFPYFLAFYFLFLFIGLSCGRQEKKKKGLASGTANLTGGEGIKNTQGMNEGMKWGG